MTLSPGSARDRVDSFSSTCAAGGIWVNSEVRNWLYATGSCSAQCREPAAVIAARKLGPRVVVACDPIIDCHITALTFVLTLGDKERFGRSRDVGCYLGLRPRRSQSGEGDGIRDGQRDFCSGRVTPPNSQSSPNSFPPSPHPP